MAAEYGQESLESLCDKLISKQCLIKLVNSATKILAENGHECVITLLKYVKTGKVIPKIVDEVSSKNTALRYKLAQYIYIIMESFDQQVLEKYQSILEGSISAMISDANKDVRQTTRQTFGLYAEKFPARAERVYPTFDASAQKTLIEEGLIDASVFRKGSSIGSPNSANKVPPRPSSAKKADNKIETATSQIRTGAFSIKPEKDMKISEPATAPLAKSLLTPLTKDKLTITKLGNSDVSNDRRAPASNYGSRVSVGRKNLDTSNSDQKETRDSSVNKGTPSTTYSKSVQEDMVKPSLRPSSAMKVKIQEKNTFNNILLACDSTETF